MKVFPQILILIFVLAFVSFGQVDPSAEAKWSISEPGGDVFSVETPSAMTVNRMKIDSKRTTLLYAGELERRYFFVAVDYPGPEGFFSVIERLIEEYGNAEPGPIVEGATSEYQFKGLDNFYHHIIQTRTPAKIYTFHALSSKENDPMVTRFVHSAKIAGKDLLPAPELAAQLRQEAEVPTVDSRSTKSSSATTAQPNSSGSGAGSGNTQTATGPNAAKESSDNKSNVNSELRLRTKPRPEYTRFARAYFLSGTVVIRATFLLNGTVGNVEVVRGLPFGLSDEAIKAAKAIKFDPAIRRGNAATVIRTIEYSFTLY